MRNAICLLAALGFIQLDAAEALAQRGRQPDRPRRLREQPHHRDPRTAGGRSELESGVAVELANGIYGVSYESVRAVRRSRVGDRVRSCLVSIPRGCPPGDDRGRLPHHNQGTPELDPAGFPT